MVGATQNDGSLRASVVLFLVAASTSLVASSLAASLSYNSGLSRSVLAPVVPMCPRWTLSLSLVEHCVTYCVAGSTYFSNLNLVRSI